MSSIQERALDYVRSLTFENLLQFLAKGLIQKGVEYLTDILDEKLEKYKVPLAIREIIKWGIRIASSAFMAWFVGESVAVSIAKYLLGSLVKTAVMKLYHAFVELSKAMLFGYGDSKVSIALSLEDEKVLKMNLIEEIKSGQYKDDPDCRKYLKILKSRL